MTRSFESTPWRQGAFLCGAAVEALCPSYVGCPVIVATHDCDLTCGPEIEPQITLIHGKWFSQPGDGNQTHAKNPRVIQIAVDGRSDLLELKQTNKFCVDRDSLEGFSPSETIKLKTDEKRTFKSWLAARYERAVFPNSFERAMRESKLKEKLYKAVKPLGSELLAVLFEVDKGDGSELTSGYHQLKILLLYQLDGPDVSPSAKLISAKQRIQTDFNKALLLFEVQNFGIELSALDIINDYALTYAQFRSHQRWPLDYLSLATGDPIAS